MSPSRARTSSWRSDQSASSSLFIYAMRMAAVFMIVVSTIGMRLGIFPRWLVVSGYAAALVLLLNVSYVQGLVLVFPAWVAAVSVIILKSSWPRMQADAHAMQPDG